jgi:DNA repair protein RadC
MMIVNQYRTVLNEDKVNVLVKEKSLEYTQYESIDSAGKAVHLMNTLCNLKNMAEEYTYMLALDCKCHVIGMFEVSHGCVNTSVVNPREVFIRALLCGALNIILIHNHPSGDTHPSPEDIKLTERVKDAGIYIGVTLIDHIIVGDSYFSFAEEHYI